MATGKHPFVDHRKLQPIRIDSLRRITTLTLALEGKRWPWSLAGPGIESRGTFSGTVDGGRRLGLSGSTGDAGRSPSSRSALDRPDTLHLDRARARWKIEGDETWTSSCSMVTSPVGSLSGQGSLPPTPERSAWLDANLDLAALARQLPANTPSARWLAG